MKSMGPDYVGGLWLCLGGAVVVACSADSLASPPINDDCDNAIYIMDMYNLPFDTTEATFDGDGWCMDSPNIWYCYIADSTGPALFSLCGSDYDTMLAVYDGCWCSDFEIMACNDDAMCWGEWELQSQVVLDVIEGHHYLIEVGGFSDDTGTGVLTVEAPWYLMGACCVYGDCVDTTTEQECADLGGVWYPWEECPTFECPIPPGNDYCENAMPVTDGYFEFSNVAATTDGPTEFGDCSELENDVWFAYEAEASGQVMVSLRNTRFDTVMAVYEGDCPTAPGFLIACNDGGCGPQSELLFNASQGFSYLIRVGGAGGAQGEGVVLIHGLQELNGCPQDLTWDGFVNIDDLFELLGAWGPCDDCYADLNRDGIVDINDLFEILGAWGDCPDMGFDDCSTPAPIRDGAYWFDTSGATTAMTPPWECGQDVGFDIWTCYQAPATGLAQFSLTYSGFDTVMQVYEGCGDEMWYIGCNDDYCYDASGVTIDVTEGAMYKVRIGGYGQDAGFGRLLVQGFGSPYPYGCPGPYDPPLVYGQTGPYFCGANLLGEHSTFFAASAMIAIVSLVGLQLTTSKRRPSDREDER